MEKRSYCLKIQNLQYALRTRGIFKTKEEVFEMMVELTKKEIANK